MGFTEQQNAQLAAKLDSSKVKQREQGGRKLSYIEGWHAIDEANRIFGFGDWSRETVELKEVCRWQFKNRDGKEMWKVGFQAKVRVTVLGVVREGTGYGQGTMGDLYDAMESAGKEAETDAMKRALMTFGNPFGLALYDKEQSNVEDGAARKAAEKADSKRNEAYARAERFAADSLGHLDSMSTEEALVWLTDTNNMKGIQFIKRNFKDIYAKFVERGLEVE